jgi:hypothetical protein
MQPGSFQQGHVHDVLLRDHLHPADGLYTPVESMPAWARRILDFSPLYYLIRTLRMVYL